MSLCLVALGSNEGDRQANLSRAAGALAERSGFVVRAQSNLYETAPVGGPAGQPSYVNGAMIVETSHSPNDVLTVLTEIEMSLGRLRNMRWGPRTIDLDLLLYDDVRLDSPSLALPHPRMAFRKFVLEPAAEIAPDWRHPTIGWTLLALRDHLRYAAPYVAITGASETGKSTLAAQLSEQLNARLIADVLQIPATATAVDSAGRIRQREIELLTRRRDVLKPLQRGAQTQLTVTDFWLEQSRAYISTWADVEARQEVAALIDVESAAAIRPKLLVLLDPPRKTTLSDKDEAIRQELIAAAESPGVGPLLLLRDNNLAAQVSEVMAAIAAMS